MPSKEHGTYGVTWHPPDILTAEQRAMIWRRDRANAIAARWAEAAREYQCAASALRPGPTYSARDSHRARIAADVHVTSAAELPLPDDPSNCSRCGEEIPNDGVLRCARCYVD